MEFFSSFRVLQNTSYGNEEERVHHLFLFLSFCKMGYTIKVNKELQIIEIDSFGNVSLEELDNQLKDICKLSAEEKILKVFVDTDKVEQIPATFSLFGFMSSLPRNIAYAMYSKFDHRNKEDLKFAETVSVNRGIRVSHFTVREEAITWLKEI